MLIWKIPDRGSHQREAGPQSDPAMSNMSYIKLLRRLMASITNG